MRITRDVLITPLLRPMILVQVLILACLCALPAAAQTFLQPTVIPTGNWPAAVYSADINNDGYPDLIYIDQGATPNNPSLTHILLNDGRGNFMQSAVLGTFGTSLVFADTNGDGKLDIIDFTATAVAGNSTGQISVLLGNGDGTFRGAVVSAFPVAVGVLGPSASPQFKFSAAAQLTSGLPNILVEDTANSWLYVFSSSGNAAFSVVSRPLGDGTGPIFFADLNQDGNMDVVIQTRAGGCCAANSFLGHGDGTLTLVQRLTTPIQSLLLKDVNLDGRPDLIAENTNGHIDVFPGNGDGTFQTTSIGGTGTLNGLTGNGGHLIATGDFNHDGLVDALTATPIGISTLFGRGTQYFGLKGIYNAGPGGNGGPAGGSGQPTYVVADFNHDGNLDLALDSPEGIAILYGNSDGSFQTTSAFPAGQPALSVALGKLTSSGYLDAVVSTGATQAQTLLGSYSGGLEALNYIGYPAAVPTPTTSTNGTAGLWSSTILGDFNGDGLLDIATAADGPQSAIPASTVGTQVQLGLGTGLFSAPTALVAPASSTVCLLNRQALTLYGNLTIGDFNSDGKSDLIVSDHLGTAVFEGGSGLAAPKYVQDFDVSCPSGTAHQVSVTAPFTGSAPDLITQQNGSLVLIPSVFNQTNNNTTGPFTDPGGNNFSIDGQITTPGQKIAPIMSTTFGGTSPTLNFPAAISAMAVADLDKDGNNDLVVVYANLSANLAAPVSSAPNSIYIWYGSGNGKFLTSSKHPTNPVVLTPSRNFYQAVLTDMNGDGIPDLVLSDGYILSVQLNNGSGTFGTETHYLAGQGINGIAAGDLRNIRHNDLVIANGGAVLSAAAANLEKLATNPDVNTGGVTVLLNAILTRLVPTLTVAANPEPSNYTTGFTLTASVGGVSGNPTPTGTVTFSVDGVVVGTAATLSTSGVATVTYAGPNTLAVGTHTVTAVYSGDTNYQPATVNGTHAVAAALISPTGTLVASPEPSAYGTPWGLTATINTTPGIPAPTGTITFYVDGAPLSTTPVTLATNGTASLPEPNLYLPAGTHITSAIYSGDNNYASITLNGTHVIAAVTLVTSVVASPEPSVYGTAFTVTATAGPGTYQFSVDGSPIGTVTNTANTASIIAPGTFAVGTHTLNVLWTAQQSSIALLITGTHQVTIDQTTLSLLLCVDGPGSLFPCGSPIDTTPLLSPVTFFYGQSLDGVATESATNLTGSILFYDGTTVFCNINANLTGGGNLCPTQSGYFNAGTRTVYATYTGDSNNTAATSNSIAVTVYPDPTTAALTSSGSPATLGTPVTFTAVLAGNYATPNGSVNFYDGTTLLGGGSLDSTGHATFTTSTLALGTHPITVQYAGNANFNPITSNVFNQVITAPVRGALSATPETVYCRQSLHLDRSHHPARWPDHPSYR